MRCRVVLSIAILTLLAGPAVALGPDITLGPERPLHPSPVEPTILAGQPSVAAAGDAYLAVWTNTTTYDHPEVGMLRAARVTPNGKVLDVPGFPLAEAQCCSPYPGVARVIGGNRTFLVTLWCYAISEVRTLLVDTAGGVKRVELPGVDGDPGHLTWAGNRYVYTAWDNVLRSIGEDGLEAGEPVRLAPDSYVVREIEAAGDRLIALLEGPPLDEEAGPGLYVVTIERGEASAPIGLRTLPAGRHTFTSFDGEQILLGFLDAGVFDRAIIVRPDGAVVRAEFDMPFSRELDIVDVVFQGEVHIVRYAPYGYDPPYVLRLDRHGDVVDAAPVFSVAGPWALGGKGILAVRPHGEIESGPAHGRTDGVFGVLLDRRGTPLWTEPERDIAIAQSVRSQGAATLSQRGRDAVAVWREQVTREEACIFMSGIADNARVHRVGCSPEAWSPSIAAGPEVSLVVWADGYGVETEAVLAVRVSHAGGVLDHEPIQLSTRAWFRAEPVAIWDGQQFVAAWGEGDLYADDQVELAVARVTSDGVVLDRDPVKLGFGDRSRMKPSLARRGDELVIAWEEGIARRARAQIYFAERSVHVRRLSTRLGVTAGPAVTVSTTSEAEPDPANPVVACHELGCLVAFTTSGAPPDVRSAFVSLDELVAGGGVAASRLLAASSYAPAATWDGRRFVVATTRLDGGDHDVVMRRLDPTGASDGEEQSVSATAEIEWGPSLASTGDGTVVVSFARSASQQKYGGVMLDFVRRESAERARPARR